MPPLSAAGPAGTVTDPFVGDPYAGVVPEFDAELWRAAGATDDELVQLTASFDELDPKVRRRVAGWVGQLDSDALAEAVQDWRLEQARRQDEAQQQEAYDALSGEDKALLEALPPEDAQALAALDADGRERLAALAAASAEASADGEGEQPENDEAPGGDGDSPPETAPVNEPPAEGDAPDSTSTEQQPEETVTFLTSDIADLTIKQVEEQVGDDPAKAQQALTAETARGDDARSTLVEKLTKLASP